MDKKFSIKQYLVNNLKDAVKACGFDSSVDVAIKNSDRPELADFQTNVAFLLAKAEKKAPKDVAEMLIAKLGKLAKEVDVTFVMPGFINFKFTKAGISEVEKLLCQNKDYLIDKRGEKKTVVLDYGGANIAKELHMGHLRSPIIGESLKRLFDLHGYKTIGDAHLGDWGLQMGLIFAILDEIGSLDYYYGKSSKKPEITLDFLNENYPKASAKSKVDPEFKAKADDFTLKLQKKEEPFITIWNEIRKVSVTAIEKNYSALNCNFELWYGESNAEPYIERTVAEFVNKGLTQTVDGTMIVDVKKEGEHVPIPKKNPDDPNEKQLYKNPMPPVILKKFNGGDLYATTDIATLLQRVEDNKNLSDIVYVTDNRQSIHFEQVFRASRKAGIVPDRINLAHIGFGTMMGKDGKPFKTRDGGVIKLEDIINLLKDKAQEKLKSNGVEDDPRLALQIGVGAMKFGDLSNDVFRDYIFDLDDFLSFEGKTGPYIQYTAVRIKSILKKAGAFEEVYSVSSDLERQIVLSILKLRESYALALNSLSPNLVCNAVYDLASKFSTFYNGTRILAEKDIAQRNAYLTLSKLVLQELEQGLNILAIDIPEKM